MHYSQKQITSLLEGYSKTDNEIFERWSTLIIDFSPKLQSEKAKEFLLNGVCRRLQAMRRVSTNVFTIYPPAQRQVLHRDYLQDIDINLQSFLINAYGILDNLAWLFIHENNLQGAFEKMQVGLHKPEVHAFMLPPLKTYLVEATFSNWFNEYAKNYRDACAHRIPIYVPPYSVDPKNVSKISVAEQLRLQAISDYDWDRMESLDIEIESYKSPIAVFSHQNDSVPLMLHPQILCDIKTILELISVFTSSYKSSKTMPSLPIPPKLVQSLKIISEKSQVPLDKQDINDLLNAGYISNAYGGGWMVNSKGRNLIKSPAFKAFLELPKNNEKL